jgi:hypothetical protein
LDANFVRFGVLDAKVIGIDPPWRVQNSDMQAVFVPELEFLHRSRLSDELRLPHHTS